MFKRSLKFLLLSSLFFFPLMSIIPHHKAMLKRMCLICDENRKLLEFVPLECGHAFCRDCCQAQLTQSIHSKTMDYLVCYKCSKPWTFNDVLRIADENQQKLLADLGMFW